MGWSKEDNPILKVLPPILKFFVVWVWVKFLVLGFLMSFLDIEDNWDLFAGAVITGMFLSLGLPFAAKDRFFDTLFQFYWKWVLLWILIVWFAITLFPSLRPWGDDAAKVVYRTYTQAKRDVVRNHIKELRAIQPKVNNETAKGASLQAALATLTPKEQALFRYYNRSYISRWVANFQEEAWPNMKVAFGNAGEGFGLVSPVDRLADEIRGDIAKRGEQKSLNCLADLKAKADTGQAESSEQQIEECRRRDPNYKKEGIPAKTKAPASTAAGAVNAPATPTQTASAPAPVAAPAAPAPSWRWQGVYTPSQGSLTIGTPPAGRYCLKSTGSHLQIFWSVDRTRSEYHPIDADGRLPNGAPFVSQTATVPFPGLPYGAVWVEEGGTRHWVAGGQRFEVKGNHPLTLRTNIGPRSQDVLGSGSLKVALVGC